MAPRPRIFSRFIRRPYCLCHNNVDAFVLTALLASGCASGGVARENSAPPPAKIAPAASTVPLAGHRCAGAAPPVYCSCRTSGGEAETEPPASGHKRFEIKMSAAGGRIALTSDVLGRFDVEGPQARCLYVDLVAGAQAKISVTATADNKAAGVLPQFSLVEYGPAGPFWYETLNVQCQGKYGQCDKEGADDWQASLASRKRGRLDPCGSAVVKSLRWDTSGSESARDGEFFHDFTVSFDMEIKAFATRFAPGSTECVPK